MKRIIEIFQADDKSLSLTRVLCFISIIPATYVLIINPTEGMMGLYLGAYVMGYISGKGLDAMVSRKNVDLS